MKILAVICEYNPFHNGHAYQLRQQTKELGCDGVVCLMSGSFVQRGEPAVLDKWARSEMALACGCDLVLELPVLYSLQSAEGFALGAVSLLSSLGLAGFLGFGSESGELGLLTAAASASEQPLYQQRLKMRLAEGMSYPQACGKVLEELEPRTAGLEPNDILGLSYIRALQRVHSPLQPAVLKRMDGGYNSLTAENEFLSAAGIRSCLIRGEEVSSYMPPEAYAILKRETAAGRAPVFSASLGSLLCYKLQQTSRSHLAHISGISEGLEKRLIDAASSSRSFSEIALAAKTKRYPQTRIQRTLLKILLDISKADEKIQSAYARVLGIGKNGAAILREIQTKSTIPVITKTAAACLPNDEAKRLFALENSATDLYSLLYPKREAGKNGMDFSRSPVLRK